MLINRVRALRAGTGWSQGELARRVDVSRQALAAIEAGRQVPSTPVALRLARALRCTVEDLFALPEGPRLQVSLTSASRSRRVVLGQVDGTWRAHPVADDCPADAVLVGEHAVRGAALVEPLGELASRERNVLIAGCAPLLGVLAASLPAHGEALATWIRADSRRALDLLADDAVHVAGLHLADTEGSDGHAALVAARFGDRPMALIGLARWRQGLAVAPGDPLTIRSVAHASYPDVRFVHRAEGSGAHRLLMRLVGDGVPPRSGLVASGHAEVARLIRLGVADAGIVFEGAALAEGLTFHPLVEERFDLVLPVARLQQPAVAAVLGFLQHRAFRAQAAPLPGYDLGISGESITVEGRA